MEYINTHSEGGRGTYATPFCSGMLICLLPDSEVVTEAPKVETMAKDKWEPIRAAAFEHVAAKKIVPVKELITLLRDRFNLGVTEEDRIIMYEIKRKNERRVDGNVFTVSIETINPTTGAEAKYQIDGWAVLKNVTNVPALDPQVIPAPPPPTPEEKRVSTPTPEGAYAGLEGRIPSLKALEEEKLSPPPSSP